MPSNCQLEFTHLFSGPFLCSWGPPGESRWYSQGIYFQDWLWRPSLGWLSMICEENHTQLHPSKSRHIFRIHKENKWGNIKVKCVVGGVDSANNIQFLLLHFYIYSKLWILKRSTIMNAWHEYVQALSVTICCILNCKNLISFHLPLHLCPLSP